MNLVLQINYDAEKLPSFLREVGVNCVEVDVPVADRLADTTEEDPHGRRHRAQQRLIIRKRLSEETGYEIFRDRHRHYFLLAHFFSQLPASAFVAAEVLGL